MKILATNILTDLDGYSRTNDDPATVNTGITLGIRVVDMGAYEFQPGLLCTPLIEGDINCDCVVDYLDLALMSANWLMTSYRGKLTALTTGSAGGNKKNLRQGSMMPNPCFFVPITSFIGPLRCFRLRVIIIDFIVLKQKPFFAKLYMVGVGEKRYPFPPI